MKKRYKNRCICAVLCVLLALSALPLTAFALDDSSESPTFRIGSVQAAPGETVQIALSVENNPGFIATMMNISYDPQVLTLTGIENGTVFPDDVFCYGGSMTEIPYKFLWIDALHTENYTQDGTLATFTFSVDENASGMTQIALSYDAGSTIDVDITPVAFAVENGTVEILSGCTVSLDANGGVCGIPAITAYLNEPYGVLPVATKEGFTFDGWFLADGTLVTESTICATADDHTLTAHWTADTVELVAKEGAATVIDPTNNFIYGLKFNVTLDDLTDTYLEVVGGGSIVIESLQIGTGTVVNLYDSTGAFVDAYTLVIFGDVNGDGAIGPDDVTKVRTLAARLGDDESAWALTNPYAFAANVFEDEQVNQTDVGIIRALAARVNGIDQVTRQTYTLD